MAGFDALHPLVKELMRIEGRAEIVDGKIVEFSLDGYLPSHVKGKILFSLMKFEEKNPIGWVGGGLLAYLSPLPQGRTFSPDVGWTAGRTEATMGPATEPPIFATEVRNKEDYEADFPARFAAKMADYFAAGTLVVWDVDIMEKIVAKYTAPDTAYPQIFHRGEEADAEPAVPGWKMKVDDLFPRAR